MENDTLVTTAFEDDSLDFESYAQQFYDLITQNKLVSENSSLNIALTAQWGSGKTYFLKNFQTKFKETSDNIIITYYSSWSNDEYNNAIAPFISMLLEVLSLQEDETKDENARKFLKSASTIVNYSKNIIFKNIIKNLFELKFPIVKDIFEKLFEGVSIEEVKSMLESDNFSTIKNEELNHYSEYVNAKKEFKKSLSEYLKSKENKKLIILIDELDRCKPSFALQTLEVVKHLFDIKNIIFVFGTDVDNLSSIIKKEYGSSIDPAGYLRRFFDYQFELPKTKIETYVLKKLNHNRAILNKSHLLGIIKHFDLSIRDIDIYTKNLELLCSTNEFITRSDFNFTLISYFLLIKLKFPKIYDYIISKPFTSSLNPIEQKNEYYISDYFFKYYFEGQEQDTNNIYTRPIINFFKYFSLGQFSNLIKLTHLTYREDTIIKENDSRDFKYIQSIFLSCLFPQINIYGQHVSFLNIIEKNMKFISN
jgi:hypothetical protein